MQTYYIITAIVVLALVAGGVFFVRKGSRKPISQLAAVAFGCIIAGLVFGENRFVGYSLLGVGVLLAVIDIVKKEGRR